MAVVLRFASSSNANGLKASAFERSTQGVGLFFNFKQQVTVASDHATFSSITAPGEFAFRLDSTAGTRWRSGRQVLNASPTDTFLIIPAAPLAFSPAALTAMLPSLPITASSVTITSLTLTLGTGIITAAGAGFYSSFFGAIPATFTYVFTLVPNTEPADMSAPGFIGSALEVRTISVSVVSAVGGRWAFWRTSFSTRSSASCRARSGTPFRTGSRRRSTRRSRMPSRPPARRRARSRPWKRRRSTAPECPSSRSPVSRSRRPARRRPAAAPSTCARERSWYISARSATSC